MDLTQAESTDVPSAWENDIDTDKVEVLPLVSDRDRNYPSGWCTYTYEHAQAPELEFICGGINAKTPRAGAIWRQGHLLHFGFEQSPAELNANGRGLLVNSICYIARFREDRPIVRTPSIFYSRVRLFDREVISRLINHPERDLQQYLDYYVSPEIRSETQKLDRDGVKEWFEDVRPFLRADSAGKLTLDETARDFGTPPNEQAFFAATIAALGGEGEKAGQARELLLRYAPYGPKDGSADDWKRWWNENRAYLFFSDTGGYCWYIDPLAKSRKRPTQVLRGPSRAR